MEAKAFIVGRRGGATAGKKKPFLNRIKKGAFLQPMNYTFYFFGYQ